MTDLRPLIQNSRLGCWRARIKFHDYCRGDSRIAPVGAGDRLQVVSLLLACVAAARIVADASGVVD